MSIEERVERIRAEQKADAEARNRLVEVKKAEFSTHARFVNSRLEDLRELKVVVIIEEFTKSSISPIFIKEDYVPEPEKPLPGPLKWPNAEAFKEAFNRPDPKDWWSAQVLKPVLDQQTLEWDRNLRLKINHYQPSRDHLMRSQFDNSPVGWVDLVWENHLNILKVEGAIQTFSNEINEVIIRDYSYYLDNIEEAIARAVIDPKTEPPRMRHFDSHTPIGVQA